MFKPSFLNSARHKRPLLDADRAVSKRREDRQRDSERREQFHYVYSDGCARTHLENNPSDTSELFASAISFVFNFCFLDNCGDCVRHALAGSEREDDEGKGAQEALFSASGHQGGHGECLPIGQRGRFCITNLLLVRFIKSNDSHTVALYSLSCLFITCCQLICGLAAVLE